MFAVACLVLVPSVAGARAPSPECVAASKARAGHKAECRRTDTACKGGDRDACSKRLSSCGLVGGAGFTDAVLKACGMPEYLPAEPPPEPAAQAYGSTSSSGGATKATPKPVAKTPLELPRYGIHVYGGPRCSLCQRVLTELRAANLSATFHDITNDPEQRELALRYQQYFYNDYLLLLVVNGHPERIEFGNIAAAASRN